MTREKSYSRITAKGQVTIPVSMRRKYGLQEGRVIAFDESTQGLILKPVRDIIDSAGSLPSDAKAEDVLKDLLKAREEDLM